MTYILLSLLCFIFHLSGVPFIFLLLCCRDNVTDLEFCLMFYCPVTLMGTFKKKDCITCVMFLNALMNGQHV